MLVKMSNALLLKFYDLIFFLHLFRFLSRCHHCLLLKILNCLCQKIKKQLSNYWSMTVRVEKRKTRVQMNFGCVYFFNNNSI